MIVLHGNYTLTQIGEFKALIQWMVPLTSERQTQMPWTRFLYCYFPILCHLFFWTLLHSAHGIINPRAINTVTCLCYCLLCGFSPKNTSIIITRTEIVGPVYQAQPPTALHCLCCLGAPRWRTACSESGSQLLLTTSD